MRKTFIRTKTRKGFEDCPWFSEGYIFSGYHFRELEQVQEDVDGIFRIHDAGAVKEWREKNGQQG